MRSLRKLTIALAYAAVLAAEPAVAAPAFKDHPATERHRGQARAVDFSTNEAARTALDRRWQDILRESAAKGPNFAGAYRLVEVGCGTGCQTVFVISAATGRIYRLGEGATYGVRFRADSRLIVIAADPVHKLPARYFVFEQGRFREVR